jgi:very-short-patch-repair endonuclease
VNRGKGNKMIAVARALRTSSTDVENLLWRQLRRKELAGLKFRRQQPIDNYVVDFACFEKRVVIEVDGGRHASERDKDAERDEYLIGNGFKVLRFWNNEVLQNIDGVLEVIRNSCWSHPPLSPLPSR